MAAKAKSSARASRAPASAQERLLDAVHQIWLAGLGAVSQARQGAPQLFEELVSEGARVHTRTRGAAENAVRDLIGGVQAGINDRVGKVRGQAADALDNLEQVFQSRVHRALTRLGVPSAQEVEALSKRVDRLNANIDKLARGRKAGAKSRTGNGRKEHGHASAAAA